MATSSKSKPKKSNGKGKGLPQIETPSYPAFVGSNLPTGGDTDPGGEQDAFDAVVPDALVADTMKPESVLISMPHLPANTCYRNSAVAALLNIAPFVNYVQSVAAEKNRENPLAQSLAGLADVFRDVDMDSETGRLSKLNKRMSVFWKWLRQQPKSNDEDRWSPTAWAAEDDETTQHDSNEFITYLFERLAYGDLGEEQTLDDEDLSALFRRMFRYQFVPRRVFPCDCAGIKERQPVDSSTGAGYLLPVHVDRRDASLSVAIARSLYDGHDNNLSDACVTCGEDLVVEDFYKFLYLPETLFLDVDYIEGKKKKKKGDKLNFELPELLDMSALRDQAAGSDEPCVYRLRSLIAYPRNTEDEAGHFLAYLRRGPNDWDEINDLPAEVTERLRFGKWNREYRPRLLMYVKDRDYDPNELKAATVATEPKTTTKDNTTNDKAEDNINGRSQDKTKTVPVIEESEKEVLGNHLGVPTRAAEVIRPGITLITSGGDDLIESQGDGAVPELVSLDEATDSAPESTTSNIEQAIPTSPNDERIEQCKKWNAEQFKEVFVAEGLVQPSGRKPRASMYRSRFLRHFENPRDYSIYKSDRLKLLVASLGLPLPYNAVKADCLVAMANWEDSRNGKIKAKSTKTGGVTKKRKRDNDDSEEDLTTGTKTTTKRSKK